MDEVINTEFDLTAFQKATQKMIATNDNAYKGKYDRLKSAHARNYTVEEIENIINNGTLKEQQKLSRNYFYKDGYYRQILIHYATLLKYAGLLIPNPGFGKTLSTSHIQKKYFSAMDFVDRLNLKDFFTHCALRALVDGSYFGMITDLNKDTFSYIDLPGGYCVSNYKDTYGNDIIEFDVSYFNSLYIGDEREKALEAYPHDVVQYFKKWKNGKVRSKWYVVPSNVGICFPLFDGRPLFLNVIPATIEYGQAVETEQTRNFEDIRKIIVQQIPHTADGRLLFEPDEAEQIHKGTVGMMKGNQNVSVLTTYADVEAIAAKASTDTMNNSLEHMLNNIYSSAGVSGQLFASTGSTTLDASIKNDMATMMQLANKFSRFATNMVNEMYGNPNIKFKYTILPISYYNTDKYIEDAFKLATSGYSLLLPAIALDLSQKELGNIKDLENDVLKLADKLIPLASAYTAAAGSGDEGGRPTKAQDEKAETTVAKEKSADNQTEGGSD